ncbi:MAG: PAS domain S-box protein [Thermoanaerobaculales bacterium]|nr:PAS domain S-box protein [Thermoanaerobaculales bacterium]
MRRSQEHESDQGGPVSPSETRLRRAQRVARLGSWELDLVTRVMWGSDEAFRIYGLTPSPDRSLPYDIVKSVPLPEHRAELDRALADLIEHGTPYEIRFRIRRENDGEIRYIHSFAEAALDEEGRPVLITGTVQDVTEHELANLALQDALRANEERALLILEQAADAIFIGTREGGFQQVNELACELTGYRRDELLGRSFELLFAPEVLARDPLCYDLLDRGETVIRERELSRKDGSTTLVEMRSKRLSDGSHQAIVRDISERKRLEEQLSLRQRMDSLGTLAGGVAHDFNNILAAIVGSADALGLAPAGDRSARDRAVANILQSCRRAADLVRGLQMLTRRTAFEMETFDLHTVAAEAFRVLEETTDRLIAKEMLIPEGRFHVIGDASAIYHALVNLGINAVQAIEEKGAEAGDVVRLEAFDHVAGPAGPLTLEPGAWVHLTLSDTGTGMPPEVRDRAFDILFTTKEKGDRKGQGLGLAMVYNVVVRHHRGLVDIETAEGEGTVFHLYLPRGERPVTDDSGPTRTFRRGEETILVIEDEPEIAALTREVLEGHGYTVLTAADGRQGLETFRGHRADVDLVILDRTLPRLDGARVMQELRALDPGVKVIVSTGDPSVDLSVFPGALTFLHKPYRLSALFDAIRGALEPVPS